VTVSARWVKFPYTFAGSRKFSFTILRSAWSTPKGVELRIQIEIKNLCLEIQPDSTIREMQFRSFAGKVSHGHSVVCHSQISQRKRTAKCYRSTKVSNDPRRSHKSQITHTRYSQRTILLTIASVFCITCVLQARREGGVEGLATPGPTTFGRPCRRPEIYKVRQNVSF